MTQAHDRASGDRPFPWQCPNCLKREVFPVEIPYTAKIRHEGELHTVEVAKLATPQCRACGQLLISDRADDQIRNALRQQLRLLMPSDIQRGRETLGLSRAEFAERLGVPEETIRRLEEGTLIQARATDNLLRVFFAFPIIRSSLVGAGQDPALGLSVAAPLESTSIRD